MGGRTNYYKRKGMRRMSTEGGLEKTWCLKMTSLNCFVVLMMTLPLVSLGISDSRLQGSETDGADSGQYPYSLENGIQDKRGFWDKRGFGDKRDISNEKLALLQEMMPQRRVSFGFIHYPRIPLQHRPFFRSNPKLVALLRKEVGKRGFWDKRGFGDKRSDNTDSNNFHLYSDI